MEIAATARNIWFLIACALVKHPNFIAQHSKTMWMHKVDKHLSYWLIFMKNCPLGKYGGPSDFSRTADCKPLILSLIWYVPHEHIPKALLTCRSNWWSEMKNKWNDYWLLYVINHYMLCYLLVTQVVSHPCTFLFPRRYNNQPFGMWNG